MGISLDRDQMRQRVSSILVDLHFLFSFSTSPITQKTNFCACSVRKDDTFIGLKKDQKVTVLVVPKAKKSLNYPNTKTSIFFTLSQLYDIPKEESKGTTSSKDGRCKTKIGFKRKHANIPRLYGVVESRKTFFLILGFHSLTLREFLIDNQNILEQDEVRRRFLFFQIFQVVFFCHKSGFSLGSICPKEIFLNDLLWVYISGFSNLYNPHSPIISSDRFDPDKVSRRVYENADLIRAIGQTSFSWDVETSVFSSRNVFQVGEKVIVPRSRGGYTYGRIAKRLEENACVYRIEISSSSIFANLADPKRSYSWKELHAMSIGKMPNDTFDFQASKIDDLQSIILKWQHGELSNFDYLMTLNALAGRKRGYWKKNPVLPWVIDFERPNGNWRDLTKTKFRMKKGDRMLDFTFDGPNPHHVTEPLSEIAYFTYLARRTPVKLLTKYVRSRYQPKEYPNSVKRMFDWTPEECIPEFYTDPTIFESIHPDMEDLQLPKWAKNAEEFIELHRAALESEIVSRNLHHWIDLIFGYKLSGKSAIEAKNVIYRKITSNILPAPSEYVQLFSEPHPKRICAYFPQIFQARVSEGVGDHLSRSSRSQKKVDSPPTPSQSQVVKRKKSPFVFRTLEDSLISTPARSLPHRQSVHVPHQPPGHGFSSIPQLSSSNTRKGTGPSNQSFYLANLLSFEETFHFASKFFKKPQYHILPLRRSEEMVKFLSKEEPVADDYFALGCVLYEIYAFEPLFTTRTLDQYLQGVYRPKYLDRLPVSVRRMVLHLIDLNATNRKKAFEFEIYNKVFPKYFKYCYHILRRYYILNSVKEKYEFAIQQEFKVVELPTDGFFLVFGHVMYDLFSDQSGWNLALLLLTRKMYREKIQHCGGCDKLTSYIIKSKLPDLLDNHVSKEVTLSLLRYSFVDFVFHDLGLSKKEFLEKILGLYIEYLYSEDKDIAKQAYYTLSKIAQYELGILLTLKHIVEKLIRKICRLCKGRTQQSRNKFSMVFMLFLNLSLILSKETMFTFFFTRFFRIFLKDYLEKKIFTNETILYSMFELLEKILVRLNIGSKTMIGHLLLAHKGTIYEVFENYDNEFCSVVVFQKIIKIICYLLHIASRDVRIKVLGHLEPVIGSIFKGEFSIQPIVKQQASQGYPPVSENKPPTPKQKLNTTGHRSINLGTAIVGLFKRGKTKTSPEKTGFLSTISGGGGKAIENEFGFEDSDQELETPGATPGKVDEHLFQNLSKRTFETSCMIYRELCCVVGNSAMRESVATAEAFEKEIQKASFPARNKRSGSLHNVKKKRKSKKKSTSIKTASVAEIEISDTESEEEGEDSSEQKEEKEEKEEEEESGEKEEEGEGNEEEEGEGELEDLVDYYDKLLTSESYQSVSNLQELINKARDIKKVPSLYWLIAPSPYDTHPKKLLDVCKDSTKRTFSTYSSPSIGGMPNLNRDGDGSDYLFRAVRDFTFQSPGRGKINGLSILEKDERIFMTYGKDGVNVWNLEIGSGFVQFGGASIRNSEFLESAEGHLALAVSELNHLSLWDVPRAKQIWSVGGVLDFCRCPHNENVIATISTESTVRFFDLRAKGDGILRSSSSPRKKYYDGNLFSSGMSGSGSGSRMRYAYEWRVMNLGYHPTLPNRPSLRTISSSKECVYLGLSSGSIVILDGKTGMMMDQFKAHEREVSKIVPFSQKKKVMSDRTELKNLFFSQSCKSNEIKFWSVVPAVGNETYCNPAFKRTLQLHGFQMASQITSFDLNLENQCVFAIGQQNIVGVAGIGHLHGRSQKMHMLQKYDLEINKMDSFKMAKSNERCTDVKMLPLHKFVLVSTDKGNIHLYR